MGDTGRALFFVRNCLSHFVNRLVPKRVHVFPLGFKWDQCCRQHRACSYSSVWDTDVPCHKPGWHGGQQKTNKQTGRQTKQNKTSEAHEQTEKQANRQTDRQRKQQPNRQTDKQTHRQTEQTKQTNKQTNKTKWVTAAVVAVFKQVR